MINPERCDWNRFSECKIGVVSQPTRRGKSLNQSHRDYVNPITISSIFPGKENPTGEKKKKRKKRFLSKRLFTWRKFNKRHFGSSSDSSSFLIISAFPCGLWALISWSKFSIWAGTMKLNTHIKEIILSFWMGWLCVWPARGWRVYIFLLLTTLLLTWLPIHRSLSGYWNPGNRDTDCRPLCLYGWF